jgi:hypothetical protein
MIRKSVQRFSEKIMPNQKARYCPPTTTSLIWITGAMSV